MKKTLKAQTITDIYKALSNAKMGQMQTSEKLTLLRIVNTFKPTAKSCMEFSEDATKKLQPENWEEITKKINNFASLPDAEKIKVNAIIRDFEAKVNECVKPELEKDVEVEFTPMNEEAIGHLLDSNTDWSVAVALQLQESIGE